MEVTREVAHAMMTYEKHFPEMDFEKDVKEVKEGEQQEFR